MRRSKRVLRILAISAPARVCSSLLWISLVCSPVLLAACGDETEDVGDASTDGSSAPDAAVSDAANDAAESDGAAGDSGPSDPGLLAIEELRFVGAFRIPSDDFGPSSANYARGALGYNPAGSLFLAGFAPEGMVAEFAIPDELSMSSVVAELPAAEALQDFHPILATSGNPDNMDTVTGMLWVDGDLIVNANEWYDASGESVDTTLVVRGGDLSNVEGYFRLQSRAHGAGYMAPIPAEWQEAFGGVAITGWASNYSIISRYSVGPSLFVFEPTDAIGAAEGDMIATTAWMNFGYGAGEYLAEDALVYDDSASDLWNYLSKGMYGFIVPGTRTFAVFGHNGGVDSGSGYKIIQSNGNECGGPCAYDPDDYYNYYWFFDVDEILGAANVYDPRPYAYGRWVVPFGGDGANAIIGGAWAPDRGQLFLALNAAGQTGDYDRPPAIVVFEIDR